MKVISRKQARASGLVHYFTGKPCHRGHINLRYVSALKCIQCAEEDRKEWRRQYPERTRQLRRQWRKDNPEREAVSHQKSNARWWSVVKDDVNRKRREARKLTDLPRRMQRAWRIRNPDKLRVQLANRRSRRLSAYGSYTTEDIRQILRDQRGKCGYCRASLSEKYHVDHIMPLAKGGSNERSNLQLLCVSCNCSKCNRDPIVHARSLGLLL